MTILAEVLVAAIWAGLCLWLAPAVWARLDRYLALLEKRAERPVVIPTTTEPIPVDLLLQARSAYADRWAQDQAVEALYETHALTGSWDGVRQAVAARGF